MLDGVNLDGRAAFDPRRRRLHSYPPIHTHIPEASLEYTMGPPSPQSVRVTATAVRHLDEQARGRWELTSVTIEREADGTVATVF